MGDVIKFPKKVLPIVYSDFKFEEDKNYEQWDGELDCRPLSAIIIPTQLECFNKIVQFLIRKDINPDEFQELYIDILGKNVFYDLMENAIQDFKKSKIGEIENGDKS